MIASKLLLLGAITTTSLVIIDYITEPRLEDFAAQNTPALEQQENMSDSTYVPAQQPVQGTPAVQGISQQVDLVDCEFPYSGTIPMEESKCTKMTDCEIAPGKWQAVFLNDCEALHRNQGVLVATETNTPDAGPVKCKIEDKISEYSSQEACSKAQKEWHQAYLAELQEYSVNLRSAFENDPLTNEEPCEFYDVAIKQWRTEIMSTYSCKIALEAALSGLQAVNNLNEVGSSVDLQPLPKVSIPTVRECDKWGLNGTCNEWK